MVRGVTVWGDNLWLTSWLDEFMAYGWIYSGNKYIDLIERKYFYLAVVRFRYLYHVRKKMFLAIFTCMKIIIKILIFFYTLTAKHYRNILYKYTG